MILPPHCSNKDILGIAFDTVYEVAISSLDGCSSKGMLLQMSTKPLSSATSAACNGRLQADCPKRPKVCPTCSSSGVSNSACQRANDASPQTEADQWLLRYEQYLDQVCGPPSALVITISAWQAFPRCLFWDRPPGWRSLQAHQISDFVQQEAANKRGGGRKLPSTAVRSVLRFLVFSGELSPGLEAAALAPRQWTHDSIPQRLSTQEVERALALYAGETPVDLRNRAILILLSRLGLRAHEVVNLCLEDINWHEAHVVIRSTKSHRDRVLPLSKEVGGALANYLCWGRPATTSRVVFLHVHAPFRPFSNSGAISRIAARALVRTGVIRHSRLGAHVFRYTAASEMVNQGANFKDVADVLGHQSLQTTGIYAKLDVAALSDVALPWMGDTP